MADLRAVCFLLALVLAGCSEGPPATQDPADTGPEMADPSGSGPEASASPTAAAPSASGPGPSNATASQPAGPVVGSCEMSATAGASPGGASFTGTNVQLCRPVSLSAAGGALLRSAVVEMTWSNASPTLTDVTLEVRDGSEVIGSATSSESPVRLELPAGAFPSAAQVEWSAMFGGTGAFSDFQATATFSLFESESPPAGYTAL